MTGRPLALEEYLDALLAPPGAPAPQAEGAPPPGEGADAAGREEFWLVTAAGVAFAVPAAEAAPLAEPGAEAEGAEPVVIDLARLVGDREAGPDAAHLALRAFPGHRLRVDAVRGRIAVPTDAVAWRRSAAGPRPWLAGIIEDPSAAVLAVAALVEEERHGHAGGL
ncbi:MAG TPA: hypothetical protein VF322_16120 [Gammaproteobacteria bacterium]